MNNKERVELITKRLNKAFKPSYLNVLDESHQHIGHSGAKDGRGHFAIEITASAFDGKKPLESHRMIYAALGDLMKTDIHALRINLKIAKE